jgi:serine/threonine-protein kinase
MEFIDGQTVQHVMRAVTRANTRLPIELAAKIARDAADALHYAHTRVDDAGRPLNIIHRDVSPQNLMVTYDGVPKLLDFGIAKAATRSNATEAGQLRGKLSYMPPEQARGELIDARADQFSLGVTLFEMLTHTRLYPPLKEMDLFRLVAMKTEPWETPKQREPSVPEELSAIVAKMMSREANDRYASMAEARDTLTAYLHTISQTGPSTEAMAAFMKSTFPPEARVIPSSVSGGFPAVSRSRLSTVTRTPRGRRQWALYAGLGVLAVVVLGAVAFAMRPTSSPERAPEPVVTPLVKKEPPPEPVKAPEPVVDAGLAPLAASGDPDDELPDDLSLDAGKSLKKPAARAKGKLSLVTSPWSNVYFGKKNLGETPLTNVPLPAGKQRLLLINDERKLRTTIEVEIKPGKTTALKLKL